MPKLTVTTERLSLRPADGTELPPPPTRFRPPGWENAGPLASGTAGRHAQASARASGLRALAEGFNDMVVDSSLRRWLGKEEPKILAGMAREGASIFVVHVNYSLNTWGDGRFYKFEHAFVVAYLKNYAELKKYLSPQRVYGPSASQTRPAYIKDYFVYLVGTRVGAAAAVS